jgi:hypothetical protein
VIGYVSKGLPPIQLRFHPMEGECYAHMGDNLLQAIFSLNPIFVMNKSQTVIMVNNCFRCIWVKKIMDCDVARFPIQDYSSCW